MTVGRVKLTIDDITLYITGKATGLSSLALPQTHERLDMRKGTIMVSLAVNLTQTRIIWRVSVRDHLAQLGPWGSLEWGLS